MASIVVTFCYLARKKNRHLSNPIWNVTESLQMLISFVFLLSGRCLDKQYQIPILVSETGISSKRTTELEEEISAILDAKRSEGNQGK